MSDEREQAKRIADRWLDEPNADWDDDKRVVARQFMRALERDCSAFFSGGEPDPELVERGAETIYVNRWPGAATEEATRPVPDEVIDPFRRVYNINLPLKPHDDEPLRDYVPGLWPSWGEFRKLLDALTGSQRVESPLVKAS